MARLSGRPLLDTAADAALFVDRAPELDRLGRAGAEGLNALVSGPRGIGRTSLLRHLAYRSRRPAVDRPVSGGVQVLDATALTEPGGFLRAVASALGHDPGAEASASQVVATLAGIGGPGAATDPSGGGDTKPPAYGVLAVDGLAPSVAQAVFGQLRDEVWQVPVSWVVTCSERDEAAFLRPPADAFFDVTLRVPAMSEPDLRELLRRRATPDELSDDAVAQAAALAEGSPRRALDLARHLLLVGPDEVDGAEVVRGRLVSREQAVGRLGTAARMLLAELEASGGASASDERLLDRLGWTRGRAAQVLGELEREGLVQAADEPRAVGRPRRVYRPTDWLTA